MKTLRDLNLELNKDPNYRAEERRRRPFYTLTQEIYNRRKELGITQAELAKRTGTRQSAISRLETAEVANISLNTVIKIAEALDAWVDIRFVPNLHLAEAYKPIKTGGDEAKPQSYKRTPSMRYQLGVLQQ